MPAVNKESLLAGNAVSQLFAWPQIAASELRGAAGSDLVHRALLADRRSIYETPVDVCEAMSAITSPLRDQRVEVFHHRELRGDAIRPEHGGAAHGAVAHEPVVRVAEVAPLVGLVAALVEVAVVGRD